MIQLIQKERTCPPGQLCRHCSRTCHSDCNANFPVYLSNQNVFFSIEESSSILIPSRLPSICHMLHEFLSNNTVASLKAV